MSAPTYTITLQSLVYGPKTITDPRILAAVTSAIQNGEEFTFDNDSMGGDPDPGITKTLSGSSLRFIATVQYQLGFFRGFLYWKPDQERSVLEGTTVDFGWSLEVVTYGAGANGQLMFLTNPGIYKAIYDYHQDKSSFVVNNQFFGSDPAWGYTKTAFLSIWDHGSITSISKTEGQTISFADE